MNKDVFRLIISSSVWGYVFIRYMDIVYERKYNEDKKYLFYWCTFVIMAFCSNILHIPYVNSIIIYILFMAGSCVLYREKGKAFILYNSFFMLFMIFLEIISVVLFTYIIPIEINSVLSNRLYMNITDIPVLLLGIILCPFIANIFKKQKINEISIQENIVVVFLLVMQIAIISYISNTSEKYSNIFISIVVTSFIVFDVFFIKIFRYAATLYEYKKKNGLLEQQNLLASYYYQKAEDDFKNSRKISHDIKRHLAVLKGMLNENNSRDAIRYIDGVESHLEGGKIKFHFRNKVLNLVLNQKYQICTLKNIKLELYVQDLELDFLDDYDITIIMSNLIDNAIDESMNIEKKPFIEVRMFELHNILNILIKNKSVEKTNNIWKVGCSSKVNHEGLGLLNVSETVSRYHGNMKIISEDCFFSVYISIPYP